MSCRIQDLFRLFLERLPVLPRYSWGLLSLMTDPYARACSDCSPVLLHSVCAMADALAASALEELPLPERRTMIDAPLVATSVFGFRSRHAAKRFVHMFSDSCFAPTPFVGARDDAENLYFVEQHSTAREVCGLLVPHGEWYIASLLGPGVAGHSGSMA